jgi:hypothetical protein
MEIHRFIKHGLSPQVAHSLGGGHKQVTGSQKECMAGTLLQGRHRGGFIIKGPGEPISESPGMPCH